MPILDDLRSLAPWHFDIEIAPGIRTSHGNIEKYENQDMQRVAIIDPDEIRPLFQKIGMAGRSFLDVACNSGGYSLLAHRMGATRVLGFDVREHWIKQAKFLKKSLNASGVEFRVIPLEALDTKTRYDVTLFKGIFYHLPDPIHDLRKLCGITNETIIIDTSTNSDIPENCLAPMQESVKHVMSGVDGLAWRPGGPKAVNAIVSWLGFEHIYTVYWRKETELPGWGRMRIVASRNKILEMHDKTE